MEDDRGIAAGAGRWDQQRSAAPSGGSDESASDGEMPGPASLERARAALKHVDAAIVALREGDRDRAVALIEAAIALDPDNPVLLANRDRLLAGPWRERG